VDCRGPNNAANAHLVTDGDVNTLFVHKMASLGTLRHRLRLVERADCGNIKDYPLLSNIHRLT
jgi:hypothetical protein